MTKQNQIEIPKYSLCLSKYNVPSDLKKVTDYFRDCGNKNYQVCLVGKKESVAKDLKEKNYQGKPFIHLDNKSLNEEYPFLQISVKNSIRRTNRLISNPENDFNTTNLGIHTLGLVPISEIKSLNSLGYGLTSWNGRYVYLFSPQNFLVDGASAPPGAVSTIIGGGSGSDTLTINTDTLTGVVPDWIQPPQIPRAALI